MNKFRSTLAEELLVMLQEKADIIPKHKYYKTTSQTDRFHADLVWTVLKWMDKCSLKLDLYV